jgi:transposase
MRKIQEILRLHFSAGLSRRQIARSCSVSRPTVTEYIERAQRAGLSWTQIESLSEQELTTHLYPADCLSRRKRAAPDFAHIHRELRRPHVTLQLLWQEYKLDHPDGYQYSQFCERYRRFQQQVDPVLRQRYRAGEKLFVDYAGATLEVIDPRTGEVRMASIFVAVLGASNYTYVEATWKQDLASWIAAHVRCFEFLGGVPRVVVPDNTRSAVTHSCYYEPQLNPTYQDLARHYQVAILPTRPFRPRDKAKVENAVLVVERWILAALRNRRFFSLGELNQAIRQLLKTLNERPFKKLPGSRSQWFVEIDQPALGPLPPSRFQFAQWKKARVNIDYHVELERHYYSVPYRLIRQEVELRYSATTLEIFHLGQRVATHRRSRQAGYHTTDSSHRPPAHRRYLEWTPSRLIHWAEKIGPQTAQVVAHILDSRRYPEQGYRSCLGLLRLAGRFGEERLEAACHRAVRLQASSYKSVQSILQTGLDRQALPEEPESLPLEHPNIRGAEYFQPKEKAHVD